MRCKNCGWPNEDNVSRCVKCNSTLNAASASYGNPQSGTINDGNGFKSTIRETPGGTLDTNRSSSQGSETCGRCGYPISAGMEKCPACQSTLTPKKTIPEPGNNRDQSPSTPSTGASARPFGGTVNSWSTPSSGVGGFFTLQRIPWPNEHAVYQPDSFSGSPQLLNRSNTDPNNNSITSKEQAIITEKDGEWYIDNRSQHKTTLLRVDRPVKLEDGDVIILGNRMFEFRKG